MRYLVLRLLNLLLLFLFACPLQTVFSLEKKKEYVSFRDCQKQAEKLAEKSTGKLGVVRMGGFRDNYRSIVFSTEQYEYTVTCKMGKDKFREYDDTMLIEKRTLKEAKEESKAFWQQQKKKKDAKRKQLDVLNDFIN